MQPALIDVSDCGYSLLDLLARNRRPWRSADKHRRRHTGRKRMISLRHAARDLHVHQLAWPQVAFDHFRGQIEPLFHLQRIVDANRVEAALQACEVCMRTKRCADAVDGIDGNHLVDAVAEDEAAIEHRYLRVGERSPFAIQITRGPLPITGGVVSQFSHCASSTTARWHRTRGVSGRRSRPAPVRRRARRRPAGRPH